MMEQEAIVARVEGDQAVIEVAEAGEGCGHCQEAGGCQSGILSQIFRRSPRQFRIANSIGAVAGERVIVRVDEGAMVHAVWRIYLLPVLLLIAGAATGTAFGSPAHADAGALLGALSGLVLAGIAAYAMRRGPAGSAMRPVLVGKSSNIHFKGVCR